MARVGVEDADDERVGRTRRHHFRARVDNEAREWLQGVGELILASKLLLQLADERVTGSGVLGFSVAAEEAQRANLCVERARG